MRSKNRLGFSCGVSGMSTVGIIRNLNIRVLTQLRLELFRVHLLLLCAVVLVGCLLKASALAAVQAWPQYCLLSAVHAVLCI